MSISVFPIESTPYGLTYGEWSARWWQWFLSIPKSRSPAFDHKGENASVNQLNPHVYFLCQTIDGIKSIDSRCVTMSERRSILMPVVNWVSISQVDGETDEEMITVAKKRMDVISELKVVINGMTIEEVLEKYRAQSPFFDVTLPEDNIFGLSPGPRKCVADGYWLFLKPLEQNITLDSYGSCSSGVTKFAVNYTIFIR